MLGIYISNHKDPFEYFQRGLKDIEIKALITLPSFESEYDLWLQIKSKNPDFIILNSDIVFNNTSVVPDTGLRFLLYLRMVGFTKHCILFGQKSLGELINSSVANAILCLKGNSYFIPFQDKLEEINFSNSLQIETDNSNLLEIIKGNLNIEKVRHEWANYWGIYSLFYIHSLLHKKFTDRNILDLIPHKLKSRLLSYEGVALRYLNQESELFNETTLTERTEYCAALRNKLKDSSPKVLYIDDQAAYGWSEILQEIIYGNKNDLLFKTIKPEPNFNEEKLIQQLCSEVLLFEPHFLLLDIRLRNESGLITDTNELSGIKLLAALRNKIPSMPIIMFTASNKAKTIIRCKELGAYEVWLKEGIDERLSKKDSVNHYIELLELIQRCVSFVSERANKFLFGIDFPLAKFEEKAMQSSFRKRLDELNTHKKHRTLVFNRYDYCILDTNLFLYNGKFTLKYYKALRCLFGVRKSWGKNVIILNSTYDEIIKHAKFHYNKLFTRDNKDIRCKTARFALSKLQEFTDKKWIFVNNLATTFDSKAYADPEFTTLIHDYINQDKTILFLTNDNKLREDIFESLTNKYGKSMSKNYCLMKGPEMIDVLKPLMGLIDTNK